MTKGELNREMKRLRADLYYHQQMNKVAAKNLWFGRRKAKQIGDKMRANRRELNALV